MEENKTQKHENEKKKKTKNWASPFSNTNKILLPTYFKYENFLSSNYVQRRKSNVK